MTTGRINQVATRSVADRESARPAECDQRWPPPHVRRSFSVESRPLKRPVSFVLRDASTAACTAAFRRASTDALPHSVCLVTVRLKSSSARESKAASDQSRRALKASADALNRQATA